MSTNRELQQKKAPFIQIGQEALSDNLSGYVRKNLEEILNGLPESEADLLCHAKRYGRVSFYSRCKVLGKHPDPVYSLLSA